PLVRIGQDFFPATWPDAHRQIASRLKNIPSGQTAIIGSGRMTNEELFLLKQLAEELGQGPLDIVPRPGQADGFLRCDDLNPNTRGAELLGVSQGGTTLATLPELIRTGKLKALLLFHEDATTFGLTPELLRQLDLIVLVTLLPNFTSETAHFVLPAAGFAEKRGSMINIHGRLQRLNQAVQPPGRALADWEILRDLRYATTGGNGITSIEDVFRALSTHLPALTGLNLSKIGSLGIDLNLPPPSRSTSPAQLSATS
ncbi:MAG: molybdopterin-dependent oxidoreductase, partial [Verrucomicrobiia bacterium]